MRGQQLPDKSFLCPPAKWPPCIFSVVLLLSVGVEGLRAQTPPAGAAAAQIQSLNDALAGTEARLEQSEREIGEMRRQIADLRQQVAAVSPASQPEASPGAASALASSLGQLRDEQAIESTQIATQQQAKVETDSRFPLKLTGLVLFNSFVNTRGVDLPATPSLATGGAGATGASMRQTVLGLDARGPHLFGATSHGDVRVDFAADATTSSIGYASTYSAGSSLLRLRTAHATLDWEHTHAFAELDKPIISPDSPSSLTAVATPALAWSGNLWAWNPQAGLIEDLALPRAQLTLEAALIDPGDAPLQPAYRPSTIPGVIPGTAEQSRWPGSEVRIALIGLNSERAAHLGFGGYFAPHRTSGGYRFNGWASTVDYRLPLPWRLELLGSFYHGQALGGLGGGGWKDYLAYSTPATTSYMVPHDIGGWSQLKEKVSERLEFNAALGLDQVHAVELRPFVGAGSTAYGSLARNRTFTGNVIYSPSAYLLFSLEYRRLQSTPVTGPAATSDIIGVAAGYKF
ncbi:MAG TPA: hypothetical protein VGD59_06250 [Acidisarcina sp.]